LYEGIGQDSVLLQKTLRMPLIERFPQPSGNNGWKFSILIPSWNNIDFLKLCIKSIEEHSHFLHQIIVHVNEGMDGTLEWVRERGYDYTYSAENVGICYPLNYGRTLMQTDYLVYMNDDMYVLPGWDKALWDAVERYPDEFFFLSSTMIEPFETGNDCVIGGKKYGTTIHDFKEQELLAHYKTFSKDDWCGSTWPPNIIHKNLWDLVGGYSIEFSPGMYSDPDFSMKLWKAGVREFKGIGKSMVYHFGSKTTQKIVRNNGRKQFLSKWGISSGIFSSHYLKRGKNWQVASPLSVSEAEEAMLKKKGFLKKIFS